MREPNAPDVKLRPDEPAAAPREQAVELRERAVAQRERIVMLREQSADRRDESLQVASAEQIEITQSMRQVNESLVVAAVEAQAELETAEGITAKMSLKAERDHLTGLPNRAVLSDRLGHAIALAKRNGKRVGLLFADLDQFKEINDSLGHAVGDGLLQSAAKRLESCVRQSDTVSRYGGDEFVIILTEVMDMRAAGVAAEKLLRAMAEPHAIGAHRLHITMSIGICLYPDHGLDVDSMLEKADLALYRAKRTGRNKYQAFSPDMSASM